MNEHFIDSNNPSSSVLFVAGWKLSVSFEKAMKLCWRIFLVPEGEASKGSNSCSNSNNNNHHHNTRTSSIM